MHLQHQEVAQQLLVGRTRRSYLAGVDCSKTTVRTAVFEYLGVATTQLLRTQLLDGLALALHDLPYL